MNTPTHIIINTFLLKNKFPEKYFLPITLGAITPDFFMFVFYFIEKIIWGIPEQQIWNIDYFLPAWQNFFDIFNSIPLVLILLALIHFFKPHWVWGKAFLVSMLLHFLLDLPVHTDDAHRHFYPFSNYQFHSSISYWNPHEHGAIVSIIEIITSVTIAFYLIKTSISKKWKTFFAILISSYFLMLLMFLNMTH
jgi:hypothetical protein